MSQKQKQTSLDLLEIVRLLFSKKKVIIFSVLGSLAIGIIIILLYPSNYTTKILLVPTTEPAPIKGRLSGLASLAGINLANGGESTLNPSLYAKVATSYNFKKRLLYAELPPLDPDSLDFSLEKYYRYYYKPSFKKKVMKSVKSIFKKSPKGGDEVNNRWIEDYGFYDLTPQERSYFDLINRNLKIEYLIKEGFVSITFTSQDGKVSAIFASLAKKVLEEILIEYEVKKAKEELTYVVNLLDSSKAVFEEAQRELALFKDQNQMIGSAIKQNELLNLQSRHDLAYQAYLQMSSQRGQTQLKVQKSTPAINVITQPVVPVKRDGPGAMIIFMAFGVLGVAIGGMLVLVPYVYKTYWS